MSCAEGGAQLDLLAESIAVCTLHLSFYSQMPFTLALLQVLT